jgi:hypothetical protein
MASALIVAALVGGVYVETGHMQSPYPYLRGQDVVPVYEGWEKNNDGTFTMVFGYMNRNYEEILNIPVGPNNSVDVGGPDRGQPTYFYPRRQQFVYRVQVQSDFGKKDLVWSLTSKGKVEKAFGSLADIYEIDRELMVKNLGRAATDLDLVTRDRPPVVSLQEIKTVVSGGTATLTAVITDDNLPSATRAHQAREAKPAPQLFENAPVPKAPRPPLGLWVLWQQYRGPGTVRFEPDGYKTVSNGVATRSTASFSEPGTYVLRLLASDSLLDTVKDVTVTVEGSPNSPRR